MWQVLTCVPPGLLVPLVTTQPPEGPAGPSPPTVHKGCISTPAGSCVIWLLDPAVQGASVVSPRCRACFACLTRTEKIQREKLMDILFHATDCSPWRLCLPLGGDSPPLSPPWPHLRLPLTVPPSDTCVPSAAVPGRTRCGAHTCGADRPLGAPESARQVFAQTVRDGGRRGDREPPCCKCGGTPGHQFSDDIQKALPASRWS